jgi:hypothetical protein
MNRASGPSEASDAGGAKPGPGELSLFFMNGSEFPLGGHELVHVLRSRRVILFLSVMAVLLAMPSGGTLFADVPMWARVLLNLASVIIFAALFPALYRDAAQTAFWVERGGIPHWLLSLPAAALTALVTEALAIVLLGASTLSRTMLLTKMAFSMMFWELVIVVLARYYAPAMISAPPGPQIGSGEAHPRPEPLAFGTRRIEAAQLVRIETDGRVLRLHLPDRIETATVRLRDVIDSLGPHGLLVHRCHWVSHAELGPVFRHGRSFRMITRSGDTVPVARERRKAVLDALAGGTRP